MRAILCALGQVQGNAHRFLEGSYVRGGELEEWHILRAENIMCTRAGMWKCTYNHKNHETANFIFFLTSIAFF